MSEDLKKLIEQSIVCLPVYNEEEAISKMIDDIRALSRDLVITDGGSTDESLKIAELKGVKVLHRPGKGKGHGMIQAMQYAFDMKKDFIVYIDCDLTYPTDSIYSLLREAKDADMVVGSRSYQNMSLKSKFLNYCLRILMLVLFFKYIKDAVSGLRVLRIEQYKYILRNQDMDLEIEMSAVSIRKGFKLKEIDYYTRVGRSKLSNKEIIRAFISLIKARFL